MSEHQLRQVRFSLQGRLPVAVLESRTPALAAEVGLALAEAVHQYVGRHRLGYYPSLEYFSGRDDFDTQLIATVDEVSWLASQLIRHTVEQKLRPVFASLQIMGMLNLAYVLPRVRPAQTDAVKLLGLHYSPDRARVELLASLLTRVAADQSMDRLVIQSSMRWLEGHLEELEVKPLPAAEAVASLSPRPAAVDTDRRGD